MPPTRVRVIALAYPTESQLLGATVSALIRPLRSTSVVCVAAPIRGKQATVIVKTCRMAAQFVIALAYVAISAIWAAPRQTSLAVFLARPGTFAAHVAETAARVYRHVPRLLRAYNFLCIFPFLYLCLLWVVCSGGDMCWVRQVWF